MFGLCFVGVLLMILCLLCESMGLETWKAGFGCWACVFQSLRFRNVWSIPPKKLSAGCAVMCLAYVLFVFC